MVRPKNIRLGKLIIKPGAPIQITDQGKPQVLELTKDQKKTIQQVGRTIKAYLASAKELLEGKYAALKHMAPENLICPGNVIIICCEDGILVRYEGKIDKQQFMIGWIPEKLAALTPKFSESVVYCYPDKSTAEAAQKVGPEIRLSKTSASTGQKTEMFVAKVCCDVILDQLGHPLPTPPSKPYCLSMQNYLEIQMLGEMWPDGTDSDEIKRFMICAPVRLPVGWQCIEIFPSFVIDHWKPDFAKFWAENDILASVVARQFRNAEFHTLDPNVHARKEFAKLFKSYEDLLNSNPEREETLQVFLKEHPVLLCPTRTKVWPKLALGSRETDFIFRDARGDYLLVELERSTQKLFLKNGHTSRELNHARGQISEWKRYLEDNLATVQRELGLSGISANPNSLIVIGRSQTLTPENRRALTTLENENPKTKIMTYDDLLLNARAVVENIFGPLWAETGTAEVYYLS